MNQTNPFSLQINNGATITINNIGDITDQVTDGYRKISGSITDDNGTREIHSPEFKITKPGNLKFRDFANMSPDDRMMSLAIMHVITVGDLNAIAA
ncbi:MAG: hypothetical protein KC877_02270 [Candidatus Kaiserbacteria bacterium]|nr:hypothetical protein [Candidatus Kaiserbacteria bacterium]MCB9816850.1 hypothetical protein [Candidatus Nomurabacteria bacterium]